MHMVRWLGIRSLTDMRRSMGYQYSNSLRRRSRVSADTALGLDAGSG